MWHAHLMILALNVMLRTTIAPIIGPALHLGAATRDMAMCKLVAAEIVLAAPQDDVSWSCTARFEV